MVVGGEGEGEREEDLVLVEVTVRENLIGVRVSVLVVMVGRCEVEIVTMRVFVVIVRDEVVRRYMQ